MIPSDECHIAKKHDSDSKWSFLHIQIMNLKEVAVELLGSQNLPSSWAGSHVLGCEQGQGGGGCMQLSGGDLLEPAGSSFWRENTGLQRV